MLNTFIKHSRFTKLDFLFFFRSLGWCLISATVCSCYCWSNRKRLSSIVSHLRTEILDFDESAFQIESFTFSEAMFPAHNKIHQTNPEKLMWFLFYFSEYDWELICRWKWITESSFQWACRLLYRYLHRIRFRFYCYLISSFFAENDRGKMPTFDGLV